MATADKLNKLLETKAAIRQAIIDKGVEVGDDTIFADYPAKISVIQTGTNGPDYTAVYLAQTSNGTNYSDLFNFCELTSIDISEWDTSQVTNITRMFNWCKNLTSLNLSNFDASNVIETQSMFNNCSKLQELRLDNCSNDTISKIITSSNFPTGTITDSEGNTITRKIYCKEANATGLTAPDGWVFEYVE